MEKFKIGININLLEHKQLYTAPQLIAYLPGELLTLKLSKTVKLVNRCVCMRNDLSRSV